MSYFVYRSFDGKTHHFNILDNNEIIVKNFSWAVEGEEIVYSKKESARKLKIGELRKYPI
jgi:hypothetical protein